MSGEKVLVFKKGEEYKIKVEKVEEFGSSLFNDVYTRAAKAVIDIDNNRDKHEKKIKEDDLDDFDIDDQKYNNIIAFTGDRGTGKTSAMVSFAKALKKNDELYKNFLADIETEDSKAFPTIKRLNFESVGIVDPSLFSDNNNIIEIIIARMFDKFKNNIKNKDVEQDFDNQKKLLSIFSKVHDELKTIEAPKKDTLNGETLDVLTKLACSTNLKDRIRELVDEYLKFMNDCNERNYLLLVIDDIDLNTKHAYTLVEQIRKYLIQSNIIILFAVKIEQLGIVIEQEFRDDFDKMLNGSTRLISNNEPREMMQRYLAKLIPEDRRLYLSEDIIDNKIDIKLLDINGKLLINDAKLEVIVLDLIYKKTGLLFIQKENLLHNIIPTKLRDFNNFLALILQFKSSKQQNLDIFEDYFINTWCKRNLHHVFSSFHKSLIKIPAEDMNKFVVQYIRNHNILSTRIDFVNDSTAEQIGRVENINTNISLGDVLYILNKALSTITEEYLKKLVFSIKTIYSIRLTNCLLNKQFYEMSIIFSNSLYNIGNDFFNSQKNNSTYYQFSCFNVGKYYQQPFIEEVKPTKETPIAQYRLAVPTDDNSEDHKLIEFIHFLIEFYTDKESSRKEKSFSFFTERLNDYIRFNIFSFFTKIIYPERINGYLINPSEESFINEIIKWRNKHYMILLLNNIEFIESLFDKFKLVEFDNQFYNSSFYVKLQRMIKYILNSINGFSEESSSAYGECLVFKQFKEKTKSKTDILLDRIHQLKLQRIYLDQLLRAISNEIEFYQNMAESIENDLVKPSKDDIFSLVTNSLNQIDQYKSFLILHDRIYKNLNKEGELSVSIYSTYFDVIKKMLNNLLEIDNNEVNNNSANVVITFNTILAYFTELETKLKNLNEQP